MYVNVSVFMKYVIFTYSLSLNLTVYTGCQSVRGSPWGLINLRYWHSILQNYRQRILVPEHRNTATGLRCVDPQAVEPRTVFNFFVHVLLNTDPSKFALKRFNFTWTHHNNVSSPNRMWVRRVFPYTKQQIDETPLCKQNLQKWTLHKMLKLYRRSWGIWQKWLSLFKTVLCATALPWRRLRPDGSPAYAKLSIYLRVQELKLFFDNNFTIYCRRVSTITCRIEINKCLSKSVFH